MNTTIAAWGAAAIIGAVFWLGVLALRLMVSHGQHNGTKKAP